VVVAAMQDVMGQAVVGQAVQTLDKGVLLPYLKVVQK
jgi:hypothetical protein